MLNTSDSTLLLKWFHFTVLLNGFCVIEMRNHKMAAIQFTSQIQLLLCCTLNSNVL